MKIKVLASGSKGNSTLVESEECKILIDIGITKKELEYKLGDIKLETIDAIIITHNHNDHIKGLNAILKRYPIKIYTTNYINHELKIKDITFKFFELSHDVSCMGMIIKNINKEVVYITDTGYINSKIQDLTQNKNCYIIESNYDDKLLMEGKYPYKLKQRILKADGHLSNIDSAKYISKAMGDKTKHIILAHLSEENNNPNLAYEAMHKVLNENINLYVANQKEVLEEIEV